MNTLAVLSKLIIEKARLPQAKKVQPPKNLLEFFAANRGIIDPADRSVLLGIKKFDFPELQSQIGYFLNEMGSRYAKYRVVIPDIPDEITERQLNDVFSAPGLPDLVFAPDKREIRVEITPISEIKGCLVIGDRSVIEGVQVTSRVKKALLNAGLVIVGNNAPLDVFENEKIAEIVDEEPLILGTQFEGLEGEIRKYVVQHLEPAIYDVVRDLAEVSECFVEILSAMREKACKDVFTGNAKAGHKAIIEKMMADKERPYPFKDKLDRFETCVLGAVAESVKKKSNGPVKTDSYECARLVYNQYFGIYYNKVREFIRAGDYQAAYQEYQRACEAYPGKKGLGEELAGLLLKEALEIEEDNSEKIEKLEAALIFSPTNKKVLTQLCFCYTNTADHNKAIKCGLAVGHYDPCICLALGISYIGRCRDKATLNEADLQAAETYLFEAIRKGYTGPQPSYNLAFIYIIKGELENAVKQMKIRYGKEPGAEAALGLLLALACSKKMQELTTKNEKSLVSFINSVAVDLTNVPTLTQLAVLYDEFGFKESAAVIIDKLKSLSVDDVVQYVQAVILISNSEGSGDNNGLLAAVDLLKPIALASSEIQVYSREKNDFRMLGRCASFYYLHALDKIDPAQAEAALPEMRALYLSDSEYPPA